MSILTQLAAIHLAGTLIIGGFVASMDTVNVTYRGRTIPCSRAVGAIVAGALWPAVIWQIIFRSR